MEGLVAMWREVGHFLSSGTDAVAVGVIFILLALYVIGRIGFGRAVLIMLGVIIVALFFAHANGLM